MPGKLGIAWPQFCGRINYGSGYGLEAEEQADSNKANDESQRNLELRYDWRGSKKKQPQKQAKRPCKKEYWSGTLEGAELHHNLNATNSTTKSKAIVTGVLNALHTPWNIANSCKGSTLVNWAGQKTRHISATNGPPFHGPRGESTYDIFVSKGLYPTKRYL